MANSGSRAAGVGGGRKPEDERVGFGPNPTAPLPGLAAGADRGCTRRASRGRPPRTPGRGHSQSAAALQGSCPRGRGSPASLAFLRICVFNPSPSLRRPLYPRLPAEALLGHLGGEGALEESPPFHTSPLPPAGALPLPAFPGSRNGGSLWCRASSERRQRPLLSGMPPRLSPGAGRWGRFSCCFCSLRKR